MATAAELAGEAQNLPTQPSNAFGAKEYDVAFVSALGMLKHPVLFPSIVDFLDYLAISHKCPPIAMSSFIFAITC